MEEQQQQPMMMGQRRNNNPNEMRQTPQGFTPEGMNRQHQMMNQFDDSAPARGGRQTQLIHEESNNNYFGQQQKLMNSQSRATGRKSVKKEGFFLQKVVMITGASSGIGRSLAFWYLNNGARVAMVGRDQGQLEEIAKQYPAQALAVVCDLTEDHALFDMKTSIADKFGRLDILINCAGVIVPGDIETTQPQQYDLMMDVNLRAPMVLTQFFLEFLRESKGCIINVSSDKGSRPEPGLLAYSMSKAGIEMLTQASAMELAPFGIRVNCVAPSFVETNLYRSAGMTEPELDALKKRTTNNHPIARVCTATEVAKSIIFLTSEHAQKITGHIMRVDGAKSLTSRGQQDWYGWQFMNRKFEQESTSYYTWMIYKGETPEPPTDRRNLEDWIDEIQESRWAIKSDEAHQKYMTGYQNQMTHKQHMDHVMNSHQTGAMLNPRQAQKMDQLI